MSSSEDKAREFLCKKIDLFLLNKESLSGLYLTRKTTDVEIFRFTFFEEPHVGSSNYIAVPLDGGEPFFPGKLGE